MRNMTGSLPSPTLLTMTLTFSTETEMAIITSMNQRVLPVTAAVPLSPIFTVPLPLLTEVIMITRLLSLRPPPAPIAEEQVVDGEGFCPEEPRMRTKKKVTSKGAIITWRMQLQK